MKETEQAIAPLSVDDLKRKAVHIKDMTEAEVRGVLEDQRTKVIIIGVVAVLAIASMAYYLGTRHSAES